jgi:hypothetical protein
MFLGTNLEDIPAKIKEFLEKNEDTTINTKQIYIKFDNMFSTSNVLYDAEKRINTAKLLKTYRGLFSGYTPGNLKLVDENNNQITALVAEICPLHDENEFLLSSNYVISGYDFKYHYYPRHQVDDLTLNGKLFSTYNFPIFNAFYGWFDNSEFITKMFDLQYPIIYDDINKPDANVIDYADRISSFIAGSTFATFIKKEDTGYWAGSSFIPSGRYILEFKSRKNNPGKPFEFDTIRLKFNYYDMMPIAYSTLRNNEWSAFSSLSGYSKANFYGSSIMASEWFTSVTLSEEEITRFIYNTKMNRYICMVSKPLQIFPIR